MSDIRTEALPKTVLKVRDHLRKLSRGSVHDDTARFLLRVEMLCDHLDRGVLSADPPNPQNGA